VGSEMCFRDRGYSETSVSVRVVSVHVRRAGARCPDVLVS
jgi:hypothetical protein